MQTYPLKRKDMQEESIGEERYLYGANQETLTVLNPVATKIWDLCDGRHTLEAIVAALHREFPDIPEPELRTDIESCLRDFETRNLLHE